MRDKKEVNIFVGAQIQTARERAGLTQDKLSELIGVSTNHLSAIERGVYGISLDNLRKICLLLDVSADYVLFGDAPSNEELTIAQKIAAVNPKHKEQVIKGINALLELAGKK